MSRDEADICRFTTLILSRSMRDSSEDCDCDEGRAMGECRRSANDDPLGVVLPVIAI